MSIRRFAIFLFLLVLHFFLLLKLNFFAKYISANEEFLDFDTYYKLSSDIRIGKNPYQVDYMKTSAPPLVFVYYLPFSFLNLGTARILNSSINILSGYILCYFLVVNFKRKYQWETFLFLVSLLFSAFPTRLSLGLGQPILLVTLLVGLSLVGKNEIISGIFLSMGSSIKTFLLFSYSSFLIRKKKIFYGTLLGTLFLVLLSFIFIRPGYYLYYLREELRQLANGGVFGIDYYNQSLKSTLHRLFLDNVYYVVYVPFLLSASTYLIVSGSFMAGIIFSILFSPVSWQHYFTILFPIYVILFKKLKPTWTFLAFIISLFLWWIEFPFLHKASGNLFNNVLASHYFFSAVLLLILSIRSEYNLN